MTSFEFMTKLQRVIRIKTYGFSDYQLDVLVAHESRRCTLTTLFMIAHRYNIRLIMVAPNGDETYVKDSKRAIKYILAKYYDQYGSKENSICAKKVNSWASNETEPLIEKFLSFCKEVGYSFTWGYKDFEKDKYIFNLK